MGITIDNITKIYGDFAAVKNANIMIKRGEFFTLLGPSGCGKTTLLRMIAGFNDITEGKIIINGNVINNVPAHKRDIGMVFQNYAIFPHMTVFENVAYGLKARKEPKKKIKKRVMEALDMVEMSDHAYKQPSLLSGGQQQRIALARALVFHPKVLLMDEPLSNLDAKLRVKMRTTIKKLQTALNITTVYVTHDQEEALAVSDRIAVMKDGVIQQIGKPEEIYSQPANSFVSGFIGTTNFIHGDLISKKDNEYLIRILGNQKLTVKSNKKITSKKALLSVRPDDIEIKKYEAGDIKGKVNMFTFLGIHNNYEVFLENGDTIEINSKKKIKSELIGIVFPKDKALIFSGDENVQI